MNESTIRKHKFPDQYGSEGCPDVNGLPKLRTRASGNRAPAGKFTRVLSKRDNSIMFAKRAEMEKQIRDALKPGGSI
jgi:hypothetical protein